MKTKIFICYRREDSGGSAGRLYDTLIREFDQGSIFRDVDSIEPGINYKRLIESKLEECFIDLVLIGRSFCNISDEQVLQELLYQMIF